MKFIQGTPYLGQNKGQEATNLRCPLGGVENRLLQTGILNGMNLFLLYGLVQFCKLTADKVYVLEFDTNLNEVFA